MNKVKSVLIVKLNSLSLREDIIVEIVERKSNPIIHNIFIYSLVCGSCSANNWYVPGYKDKKVRMCDNCFKELMTYKVSAHNIHKQSVWASSFTKDMEN